MKKILGISLLILLISSTSFAAPLLMLPFPTVQEKVGVNFASFTMENSVGQVDATGGLMIGAIMKMPLLGNITLQPELLYSKEGGVLIRNLLGGNTRSLKSLDFIKLPILVKFGLPLGFSVYGGPYVSYLLEAKEYNTDTSISVGGATTAVSTFADIKSQMPDWDLGVVAGFDWFFTDIFSLDARYALGLSNLNISGTNRSAVFSLSCGLKIL